MKTLLACCKAITGYHDVSAFWELRERILSGGRCHQWLEFFCSLIRRRYGAGIPVSKDIEPFHTPHAFHGIFISKHAVVKSGCTIYQQVTIGQNNLLNDTQRIAPFIENDVYIGAGAKIIGLCTVGRKARIGANAIVVEDIPENATVVMEKPRILIRKK